MRRYILILLGCVLPGMALCQTGSLFQTDLWQGGGQPVLSAPDPVTVSARTSAPSLFVGRDGQSFFRPFPVRIDPSTARVDLGLADGAAAQLRDLIALAEAGPAGYDAVVWGARIQPPAAPTQLTIAEIYHWIDATPGQNHAIGRYQFIPTTLRRLVDKLGLSGQQRFSPVVQDKLANLLLAEAGLQAMQRGDISKRSFMGNLAKIWAGLPTPSGKSHYHGYAGNKATVTWARFETEMRRIFPAAS